VIYNTHKDLPLRVAESLVIKQAIENVTDCRAAYCRKSWCIDIGIHFRDWMPM